MRIKSNLPEASKAFLKEIERRAQQAALRAARTAGIRGEALAKRAIAKEAHDTGEGLNSVTHDVVLLPNSVRLAVFAAAEHMYFVEHGRKPGKWPNLDALTKWVGRKLREQGLNTRVNITFDQLKALAKSTGKRGTPTASTKAARAHMQALYLIGRKIANKGIKEKLIFKQIEAEILRLFRVELIKELKAL